MTIRGVSALLVCLFLIGPIASAHADDSPRWVTYEGGDDGPGVGRHVVLVSGDEEYRSEETLPQLGKMLATHYGFRCTVLFAIDPETGQINPNQSDNIPGLHHLEDADLMVIFTRFRALPDEQMRHIERYLQRGGPVVGLRTATHAFRFPEGGAYAHWGNYYDGPKAAWKDGFGQVVLGENWVSHRGKNHKEATRGIVAEGAGDHPVLNGIEPGEVFGHSGAYTVERPLPGTSQALLLTEVVNGMGYDDPPVTDERNDNLPPLAWVRTYDLPGGGLNPGRVFTTTMGANVDLQWEGTRRLLVNACLWAMSMEVPAEANVELVGDFDPTPYGFDGFKQGMTPCDFAMDEGGE